MKKLIRRKSLVASVLLVFGMSIGSYVNTVSAATTYKTVQVNGLDIFYREAGPKSAPTILLLLHALAYDSPGHSFGAEEIDLRVRYEQRCPFKIELH